MADILPSFGRVKMRAGSDLVESAAATKIDTDNPYVLSKPGIAKFQGAKIRVSLTFYLDKALSNQY
jgi:hypothetical protein